MSETDPTTLPVESLDVSLYSHPDSVRDIARRQAAYWCLARGVQPPDYDIELISAIQYAGVPFNAVFADFGSGAPEFPELLIRVGYEEGEKYAIDPNTESWNGYPYWQPKGTDSRLESLRLAGDHDALEAYYTRNQGNGRVLEPGITLIKADGEFIPLPSGSIDVVTSRWSGYHGFKNPKALFEIGRILSKGSFSDSQPHRPGIHGDLTSGNENKERSIGMETEIAQVLNRLTHVKWRKPASIQSGFTSEKTLETFPDFYKNVYVKHVRQKMLFTLANRAIILNALKTYRVSYILESGNLDDAYRDAHFTDRQVVKEEIFDEAVEAVAGAQIDEATERGEILTDKVRRTVIFGSDEEIDLPTGLDGYEKIA